MSDPVLYTVLAVVATFSLLGAIGAAGALVWLRFLPGVSELSRRVEEAEEDILHLRGMVERSRKRYAAERRSEQAAQERQSAQGGQSGTSPVPPNGQDRKAALRARVFGQRGNA